MHLDINGDNRVEDMPIIEIMSCKQIILLIVERGEIRGRNTRR